MKSKPPPPAYPTTAAIAKAVELLTAGELVAFATETVYGLGANALSDEAVAKIYAAKSRPAYNPLISHVGDVALARRLVRFSSAADRLVDAFWPGPLTVILPIRGDLRLSPLVTAGLSTAAVRMPAHPVAAGLLQRVALPIAAPSANRSGHISPTTAAHIRASLGDNTPFILEGGGADIGLESTVVDLSGPDPALLRPGSLSQTELEAVLGRPLIKHTAALSPQEHPVSPGQLSRHYAPDLPVRLNATRAQDKEILLAFGDLTCDHGFHDVLWLSKTANLTEAASRLFACLHRAEAADVAGIAVSPIPADGLGEALNDRLRRAAAAPRHAGETR